MSTLEPEYDGERRGGAARPREVGGVHHDAGALAALAAAAAWARLRARFCECFLRYATSACFIRRF